MYLTKEDVVEILKRIQSFENDLNSVFSKRGYDLRNNLGRRNALISLAQERETANVLRQKFKNVIEDGAPGKPDIYIADIKKELECKLTSGSKSKSSVSYSLQTDWETLCNKKTLDYMYILANADFKKFCVLFFEGLTPDDFFPPASGSRGKSRMNKTKAMKKVIVLHGGVINNNNVYLEKIKLETNQEFKDHMLKMRNYNAEELKLKSTQNYRREEIKKIKENEIIRHRKKIKKLSDRRLYWSNSPDKFKMLFEEL